MISLIIKNLKEKKELKFVKGKGSLTIPLGKKTEDKDKDLLEEKTLSSFSEWNKSLKSK